MLLANREQNIGMSPLVSLETLSEVARTDLTSPDTPFWDSVESVVSEEMTRLWEEAVRSSDEPRTVSAAMAVAPRIEKSAHTPGMFDVHLPHESESEDEHLLGSFWPPEFQTVYMEHLAREGERSAIPIVTTTLATNLITEMNNIRTPGMPNHEIWEVRLNEVQRQFEMP